MLERPRTIGATTSTQFRNMVAEKFGADKAAHRAERACSRSGYLACGRADRCVTCHQAVSWKGFESAEQPFRTHPAGPLVAHPIEKLRLHRHATAARAGRSMWTPRTVELAHWEEPLLSRSLGEPYIVGRRQDAP